MYEWESGEKVDQVDLPGSVMNSSWTMSRVYASYTRGCFFLDLSADIQPIRFDQRGQWVKNARK